MSNVNLGVAFIIIVALSIWVTGLVRQAALAARFVDYPDDVGKKKHRAAIPTLGGVAIYLSFFSVIFYLFGSDLLPKGYIHLQELLALAIGGLILIIGGALDEKFNLPASRQIIFPVLAAALAIFGGIHFTEIRNPFGGMIHLDQWNFQFPISNFQFSLIFPADALSFLWLLGIIYTTKLLDGLDGLSAGSAAIASIFIVALSLRPELGQLETALIAGVLSAVLLGFLVWNFNPARIFLGEGGSTLLGFLVGALSIAAGTKVATTLLVMGLPVLDVATVIIKRWKNGKKITEGGREHLHFRMLDAGLSHTRVVLIYYAFAAAFGGVSWFLGTGWKLVALFSLFLAFLALLRFVRIRTKIL